jgi:hypothetical protein
MSYLPKLATFMAIAALAAIGALLFAGRGEANAAPVQGLKGVVQATSPVETIGYYRRYRYAPEYAARDYVPNYGPYSYRGYDDGHYEIKELQRMWPETNWPPSMRYYQRY